VRGYGGSSEGEKVKRIKRDGEREREREGGAYGRYEAYL